MPVTRRLGPNAVKTAYGSGSPNAESTSRAECSTRTMSISSAISA